MPRQRNIVRDRALPGMTGGWRPVDGFRYEVSIGKDAEIQNQGSSKGRETSTLATTRKLRPDCAVGRDEDIH